MNQRIKKTLISAIPKEWNLVKLKDIVNLINGRAFKPIEWSDKGLPIIRIQNLNDQSKPFNYCDFEVPKENIINHEDILLAWSGTPGTSFGIHRWSGGKAVLNQHIFKVIFRSTQITKAFFVIASNHKLGYLIEKAHGGAGLKHVTKDVVNQMQIPLPPLAEQEKIAEILMTVDKAIEEVDEAIKKTHRLKEGLMQKLLTNGIGHTEFKDAEIGKIPDKWKVVKLNEIAEINKESVDPARIFANEKFLYVDIDSVENGIGFIRHCNEIIGKDAPSRARRVLHHKDIIMSTVRPYLKAFAIVPQKYNNQICSTGFAVLTCKEKLNPLFLLYVLFSKSVIDQCNRMMIGAQYPALNASQVESLKIMLPLIDEQNKIAEILSAVDTRLQLLRNKKEKLERIKKGLMNDLLTGRKRVLKMMENGEWRMRNEG